MGDVMYFKYLDATIYYKIVNKGKETIILLHGNGEDMTIFNELLPFLKDYTVILVDSRGHGKSTCNNMSLALMKDDLLNLIAYLKINKCTLIGYSDGGNVALDAVIANQTLFSSLIIAGANIKPNGLKLVTRIPIIIKYCFSFNKRIRALNRLMVKEPNISIEGLKKIEIPTLIIQGEYDCVKLKHARLINRLIPSSILIILKGINHEVFKHNITFRKIMQFLNKEEL